jgi:hypothetical protein
VTEVSFLDVSFCVIEVEIVFAHSDIRHDLVALARLDGVGHLYGSRG